MNLYCKHISSIATAAAVAIGLVSCSGKLKEAETINLDQTPSQIIHNMFAVQTKDGVVNQRIETPLMERYNSDTLSFDLFPEGIAVFSYTEEGLLESVITADKAEHRTEKNGDKKEDWSAYGHVVIKNVIKEETMKTDTIYWDRQAEQIYTDCYVRLISKDGMMQGYGLRSDDRARNAIILNTFDSFGYTASQSSVYQIDSVNFIGPLLKN